MYPFVQFSYDLNNMKRLVKAEIFNYLLVSIFFERSSMPDIESSSMILKVRGYPNYFPEGTSSFIQVHTSTHELLNLKKYPHELLNLSFGVRVHRVRVLISAKSRSSSSKQSKRPLWTPACMRGAPTAIPLKTSPSRWTCKDAWMKKLGDEKLP